MADRLKDAASPYLLQHADNPVDWWEWSEEAFDEARRRDVPVFLSVGYATCHWCHVMAHDCFEDDEVAGLLNDAFVCIKVDREERPDVDELYMAVCQMMTGRGGWPLTVLLTPDKVPFYTGTYFPKHSRGHMPGLMDLVPRVAEVWKTQRDELVTQGKQLLAHFKEDGHEEAGLEAEQLDACLEALMQRQDKAHGGFGQAPKFPSPHNLLYLMRMAQRKDDAGLVEPVRRQLDAMNNGGIRDHVGGGFHRYSTDANWLLPHFEKMLYDQAMIATAAVELSQYFADPLGKDVAQHVFDYVLRDLQSPEGGFYSAEDADSDGEEGTFYVWSTSEIEAALGPDAPAFCQAFGVKPEGNFLDEATRKQTGTNVLHTPMPIPELAKQWGIDELAAVAKIDAWKTTLFNVRARRNRPLLDDKILTDWNGLMVVALAKGAVAFDDDRLLESARKCLTFVRENLWDDGRLYHRFRGGRDDHGFLSDYAYLAWGLVEMYEATFEPAYLAWAKELAHGLEAFAHDGAYATANTNLPARRVEAYDGALPSANAVAAWIQIRIANLTGDTVLDERGRKVIARFGEAATKQPYGFVGLHLAAGQSIGPNAELLITGSGPEVDAMVEVARNAARFNLEVLVGNAALGATAPWTAAMDAGELRAYLCERHTCQHPVQTASELAAGLEALS